jgi:hypothetical protein
MARPDSTTPGSVMPRYPHLLADEYNISLIGAKMRALRSLGVPYSDGDIDTAVTAMRTQANAIAAEVEGQQGPKGLADKEIVALIAYLQRLGTDIKWKRPQPQAPLAVSAVPTTPAAPATPAAPTTPAPPASPVAVAPSGSGANLVSASAAPAPVK